MLRVDELALMTEQVKTGDGSWTLKSEQFGVTYHSVHGARTESEHVFIDYGLAQIPGDGPIRVFEVGFGTGLNAGLAWAWAKRTGRRVEYRAVEAFPVEVAVDVPGLSEADVKRLKAGASWETPEFGFEVEVARLEDVKFEQPSIDIVFFDAFAPSAQPELWRQEVFEALGDGMVDGGRLVTYCAQGEARRAMRAAGWRVEKAPGPPGKHEMTVAFREAVNRFNVRAYALIVEGDRVLTVREALPGGPATKFPGGGVEFGEGPEDAVLRELREELGEVRGAAEITGHAYTTGFYVRSIFRPSDQILSLYYYVRLKRPLDVPTAPEAPVGVAGGEAGLKWRWARLGELGDLAFPIDRHVAEHVLKA
mgnify:CR=1 FL=1